MGINCSTKHTMYCEWLWDTDDGSKNEPVREKTNNLGFRPGPTQTRLYSHIRWLEA